jgi:HAD superfamily hydrolase (TIGR01490 family)
MNNVAIFDIDNTLVRGSTLFHLGVELKKEGILDLRKTLSMVYHQGKYRATSFEGNPEVIKNKTLSVIKDLPSAYLDKIIVKVVDKLFEKNVYEKTVAIIDWHKKELDEIWLATAGPDKLAKALAKKLGIYGGIGTEVEVKDGLCTGLLRGPLLHGRAKAEAIKNLNINRGWGNKTIYTYSDSYKDLPMLLDSDIATAVNPDKKLRNIAKEKNWEICDNKLFTDKVVYQLLSSPKNIISHLMKR